MKILGRKENTGNKCPVCRNSYVDFLDLGKGLLGCLQCGLVFITKDAIKRAFEVRNQQIVTMKERLVAEQKAKDEEQARLDVLREENQRKVDELANKIPDFSCIKCGTVAKSLAGLKAHERYCERTNNAGLVQ